jgi:IS5 family transposase
LPLELHITRDFFRCRLEQMIDLKHPLAVLAGRLPWAQMEADELAPFFARQDRQGKKLEGNDLFGTTVEIAGGGVSQAGRPRLPIRLMTFAALPQTRLQHERRSPCGPLG